MHSFIADITFKVALVLASGAACVLLFETRDGVLNAIGLAFLAVCVLFLGSIAASFLDMYWQVRNKDDR